MRDRYHTNFPRVRHDEHGLEQMWTWNTYAHQYECHDMLVYRPYTELARRIDALVGVKPRRCYDIEHAHKQLIDAAAHGLGHGDVHDWYPGYTYVDSYLSQLIGAHMTAGKPFVIINFYGDPIGEEWALGDLADALKKLGPTQRRSIYVRLNSRDDFDPDLYPADDLVESNDFYTNVILGRGDGYGTCHYNWRYNDKLAVYR